MEHPRLVSSAALLLVSTGCAMGLDAFTSDSGVPDVTDGFTDGLTDGADGGTDGADGGTDGADGGTDGADGGTDGADGADGTSGLDPLTLATVTPDYGSTLGNERITITGGPFDTSARVWFGANEATVRNVTSSSLEVDTPSTANSGIVDLRVETTTHEGEQPNAFTYWADASGSATVLGLFSYIEPVGSYWGSTPTPSGSGAVYFTDPTTVQWSDLWSPGIDTCVDVATYSYSGSITVNDPGASSLTLSPTSGSSVSMAWDTTLNGYSNDALTSSTYRASTSYTLQPLSGGAFPEVVVSNFLRTPGRPSLSTPYITGSSIADISRFQSFSWSSVGADWVLIEMSVWNTAGTGYQQTVRCVVRDDGFYTFDGSRFSSWPASYESRQVDVIFGYATESTGTIPWDNSSVNMTSLYMIYGAGFAY